MSLPTHILRLTSWRYVIFQSAFVFPFLLIFALGRKPQPRHSSLAKNRDASVPTNAIYMLTPRNVPAMVLVPKPSAVPSGLFIVAIQNLLCVKATF